MFSQLNQLLKANDKIVINVENSGEELSVVANGVALGSATDTDSLNKALMVPFAVKGSATDLDAQYGAVLANHVSTFDVKGTVANVSTDTASPNATTTKTNDGFADIDEL